MLVTKCVLGSCSFWGLPLRKISERLKSLFKFLRLNYPQHLITSTRKLCWRQITNIASYAGEQSIGLSVLLATIREVLTTLWKCLWHEASRNSWKKIFIDELFLIDTLTSWDSLSIAYANQESIFIVIGGFHVTSSPPCWWTVNKRSLISSLCLYTSNRSKEVSDDWFPTSNFGIRNRSHCLKVRIHVHPRLHEKHL